MQDRRSLSNFYLFASYFLLTIPFILIFNDVLTKVVNQFRLYVILQQLVTPVEIRIVGYIVRVFGINYIPLNDAMIVDSREIAMNWNCLGWQSLILFIGSAVIGLRGKFSDGSKLTALLVGLFGIFWINILRICLLVLLFAYSEAIYTYIFHDYFAAIVTILWLAFFWWFAYGHILDETGEGGGA